MNLEQGIFADVENRIEMWFEKEVDNLDKKYMSTNMTEAEYDREMNILKEKLEHKQNLFRVLFPQIFPII